MMTECKVVQLLRSFNFLKQSLQIDCTWILTFFITDSDDIMLFENVHLWQFADPPASEVPSCSSDYVTSLCMCVPIILLPHVQYWMSLLLGIWQVWLKNWKRTQSPRIITLRQRLDLLQRPGFCCLCDLTRSSGSSVPPWRIAFRTTWAFAADN